MGLVPKKTKVGYHVIRHVNMIRVVGFIMTLALSAMLSELFVTPKLSVPFSVFCCIEFFILSGGSPSDPTKSFAAAWLDWFGCAFRKNKMYNDKDRENIKAVNLDEAVIEAELSIEEKEK